MSLLKLTKAFGIVCLSLLSQSACTNEAQTLPPPANLNLNLPNGFKANIFSQLGNIGTPRMMAIAPNGMLTVALVNGKIVQLPDADQNGVAEAPIVIAENLNSPNAVAFADNFMFISNQDGIVKSQLKDGVWTKSSPLISNLPDGGHTLKTVKIGPDNHLYLNVGSSCNVCTETDPMRATILRFEQNGKPAGALETLGRHAPNPTWARGLRNSQSFAWHPKTGAMFATNNGADMRSDTKGGKVNDDIPPEHFNQIVAGQHYGWPHCWGKKIVDPNFAGSDGFCATSTPPAITFDSHSTPIGVTFLDKANFSADYKNDAIVALHGSWNRKNPSGYKLVRVKFEGDKPVKVEDFVTGWLTNKGAWGRPVDVIVGHDGALYVSDDRSGYIVRITYTEAKK